MERDEPGSRPIDPMVVGDRFPTYAHASHRRVWRANLHRDMQAIIDDMCGGEIIGGKLLYFSGRVFAWWRALRPGAIHRQTLRGYVAGLRLVVRSQDCDCQATGRACRKLMEVGASLWTFAKTEGVPPHNNASARLLWHGAIWRKIIHGTDSDAGSRFVVWRC